MRFVMGSRLTSEIFRPPLATRLNRRRHACHYSKPLMDRKRLTMRDVIRVATSLCSLSLCGARRKGVTRQ